MKVRLILAAACGAFAGQVTAAPEALTEVELAETAGGTAANGKASGKSKRLSQVQVTATGTAAPALDVPQPITIVDRDTLEARMAPTPMEALRGETGVFVQQTTPGQSIVIVRGLKGSEVLQMVDGFRLNNAIFRNSPNQYMALVDGESLERIEVVRGPMATLYGGDAMGGVVHMISWQPRFQGQELAHEGRVGVTYGSADDRLSGHADAALGNERWSLAVGGTYQDTDERRVGGGRELPFTSFTARAGNVALRYHPIEGHELLLATQYYEQPNTPRFDELVPGFGQTNPTSAEFRFEPQVRRFSHARYTIDSGFAGFEHMEFHAGRQTIRDDRANRDFGGSNRDSERNTVDTDGLTWQASRAIGDDHDLTLGAQWYRDKVASSRIRTNINSGAVSARPSRFPDGSTMRQLGLFITDQWQIDERWLLDAGLRYSRVNTFLPPVIGGIGVDLDNDDVGGNVGVNFAITDALRVVANVGRGFRAPNVFDLGVFGDRPSNRFSVPNPDLKPETVLTYDLGVKFDNGAWSGEAVAFRSDYTDKITAVLTGETTSSGRLIVINRNVTEQKLHGVELGARYQFSDQLALTGTATWTRGDETLEGQRDPADRIPPFAGRVGAAWNLRDDLSVDADVLFATRQDRLSPRDLVDPRINPEGTAGWATLNVGARWDVREDVTLRARLENLTDKAYREHGSGLDSPGRNVLLGAEWRF